MFFELEHVDKNTGARAGIIHTDHGDIATPCFMPVGTQATVKTLDDKDLENLGAQIILGNTYHLHLRPGEELIDMQGGLHNFMNWQHPILTDSGGFQVFSLGLQKEAKGQSGLTKITDDGVEFRSHIDGSKHFFSPEKAIEIQHKLGADIIMAFDECTPDTADEKYTRAAMDRTHAWAKRCIDEHQKNTSHHGYQQFLFGIIQGAKHKHLREESARAISALPFDGIAIGGESIGYNMEATAEILDWMTPIIPADKPHYAMGVGLDPKDLLTVVAHGVDIFDCVAPTRLARHGMVYTNTGRLNIRNAACARDRRPIEENCHCPTCQRYSRSYLHHLFAADEITGLRLTSLHNIYYMLNLMRAARIAILEDRFADFIK